jgi:FKBP-type peptidyl-prolyl cis-trans isomerase (trigger factor)
MTKKTTTTPAKEVPQEEMAPSLIAENTKITITIPWEKAKPAYQKARAQFAKTVKVSGFRKGKVPADVVEKMMGTDEIIEKAIEFVLPEAYVEQIKKENKQPLTHPTFTGVSLKTDSDWVIEAQIAEKPEIVVGDYKKTVKDARKHVTEELEKREKEAAKAKKEPKTEKNSATPAPKPLTDDQKKEFTLQHMYQHLIEVVKPRIPELLVRREVEYDLEQLARQLKALNMTFEHYLERRQITQEMLTQQMALAALGRLQLLFIMDKISQEQKFDPTPEEIEQYMTEKVEPAVRQQYAKSEEYKNMLRQTIMRQKVADYLLAL